MSRCSVLDVNMGEMSVQLFNSHKILMEKGKKLDNKEVLITFEKLDRKKLVEKLRKNRLNHKSDEA